MFSRGCPDMCDAYHSMEELYEFRKLYNAALFNAWSSAGMYDTHKSWRHSDGELCFGGGWFIVVATTPFGDISNHYPEDSWDFFNIEERDKAKEWDGHTSVDVLDRLAKTIDNSARMDPYPLRQYNYRGVRWLYE